MSGVLDTWPAAFLVPLEDLLADLDWSTTGVSIRLDIVDPGSDGNEGGFGWLIYEEGASANIGWGVINHTSTQSRLVRSGTSAFVTESAYNNTDLHTLQTHTFAYGFSATSVAHLHASDGSETTAAEWESGSGFGQTITDQSFRFGAIRQAGATPQTLGEIQQFRLYYGTFPVIPLVIPP